MAYRKTIISVIISVVTLVSLAVPGVFADAPNQGGTLVYLSSKIPSLNPLHAQYDVGLVSSQIFATLVRLNEDNMPVPYLAESYAISDDGLTYTFNLVKNAKFHDGKPVTAADVAFSLRVVQKLHRFGPQMFGPVEKIETPDDHTAIFRLSKPHGPLLLAATTPRQLPIMPKHVYGDGDFMTHPAHKNPVGSGPFIIKEKKTDQYVIIERNKNHFVKELPYLDQIIYQMVTDKTAKRIGLRKNQFQLAQAAAVMRYADIDSFKKIDHLALSRMNSPNGAAVILEFNNRQGPLSKKEVRQAIAYGIDRSYISRVLHQGYTIPSKGPLPSTNIFFNDKISGYPFDVEKANKLLDKAGYPRNADGIRFELGIIYIAQPFWPDLQQVIGEYVGEALKKVGIKVNQTPMAGAAAWSKRIADWNYDMSLNWAGDKVDPAIGVSRLYDCNNIRHQAYTNTSGYCNKEVDEIFAQAALESDFEKRKALYGRVTTILLEEIPMNWLFDTVTNWFHHKDLFVPTYGYGEAWDLIYWKKAQ